MADDQFMKRSPDNLYGHAHKLKMADDEYKKREAGSEPVNIYGVVG